jgi:poly(A) polymerase
MKLSGDWIEADHVQQVLELLEAGGHQGLLVGGCVRNALLGQAVSDIDISTDARPERVLELASAAGLRAVPTGIDHGTVTVIADHQPHEITTFRRDVETFGRHAVVAFSDRIEEDAARRDFTMNALYARADGQVLDPLGSGLADLSARHVRFVGHPEDRIREDYLRILRFFRFTAWYGDPAEGPDPDGLAACAEHALGTEGLSRERLGGELKKMLSAPDPAPAVGAMQATGVLGHVLPGAEARALAPLVHLEGAMPPDPIRRLAVLGGEDVAERLRLSRAEARRLELLRIALDEGVPEVLGYRLGADEGANAVLIRAALIGTEPRAGWQAAVARGAAAQFPVAAADLMPALSGAALGARLKQLEEAWIASGFRATRDELLS